MSDDIFRDVKLPQRSRTFNNVVAVCVAIISALLALATIKGGNVTIERQRLSREAANYWNQYQAKRLREHTIELRTAELRAQAADGGVTLGPAQTKLLESWETEAKRYEFERSELTAQARASEARIQVLNVLDDQLDGAEAFLAISLALLAVAALTGLVWLLFLSLGVGAVGVFFGTFAALGRTDMHPDWLMRLIG